MTSKFDQVWKSIAEDEEYRREFNLDFDTTLAFQLKLLRERNGWTQQQLAERVGSRQETISQWENPNYGRYTIKTLKSLASVFDVGLMVKFAPFSEVVEWNANLTPGQLAPPNFDEEDLARRTSGRVSFAGSPAPTPVASTAETSALGTQGTGTLFWTPPPPPPEATTHSDEGQAIAPKPGSQPRGGSSYGLAA